MQLLQIQRLAKYDHPVHREGVSVWCQFLSVCLVPCSFWEGGICTLVPCSFWDLCEWSHVLSRKVSLQGVSLHGSLSRGSLSRGLCPEGSLCPGGSLSSVGLCPGVSLSGRPPWTEVLPIQWRAGGTHPTGMFSCFFYDFSQSLSVLRYLITDNIFTYIYLDSNHAYMSLDIS